MAIQTELHVMASFEASFYAIGNNSLSMLNVQVYRWIKLPVGFWSMVTGATEEHLVGCLTCNSMACKAGGRIKFSVLLKEACGMRHLHAMTIAAEALRMAGVAVVDLIGWRDI